MAMTYQTTPEQLAELVTKHLNETYKDAIKQKLLKQLDPIVEEIAQEWAEALEARVFAANDYGSMTDHPLKVSLHINRKEVRRRTPRPE